MGIKERKERMHADRRRLILDTARRLFFEQSVEGTTMRHIAKEIEHSVSVIYRYFPDKDSLMLELQKEGFRTLGTYFATIDSSLPLEERFHRLGLQYIRFAFDFPDLYKLMFLKEDPMNALNGELWEEGMHTYNTLKNLVVARQELGWHQNKNPDHLTFMVWTFVHGLVSVRMQKRLDMLPEELREDVELQCYKLFTEVV